MITKKNHHYERLESFLAKKFSASPDNTTYTYGGEGEVYQGEPDISWYSVVYVKDVRWICTHGAIYDVSGENSSSVSTLSLDDQGSEEILKDVESSEIYVLGKKAKRSYLDVIGCSEFVNYELGFDTNIYLPFVYGGSWTRTKTKYYKFVTIQDLLKISGKTIIISNKESSSGILNLVLGNSPSWISKKVTLLPGEICVLKLKADIISGNLSFYWESSEVGKLGLTRDWI